MDKVHDINTTRQEILYCDTFLYTSLRRSHIMKEYWTFSSFLHILRWPCDFYTLFFVYAVSHFCILSHPCIPKMNPTSSWRNFLISHWSWFTCILLMIFSSLHFMSNTWICKLFVLSLSASDLRVMMSL